MPFFEKGAHDFAAMPLSGGDCPPHLAFAALFLTQPSLSRAIHAMEEEFHIRILARSSRDVSITQEGEELEED